MTRGRRGAPDARRFAVYRNNVAVGLIGALEARYPAVAPHRRRRPLPGHGAGLRPRQQAALAGHDRLWRGFPGFRRRLGRGDARPRRGGAARERVGRGLSRRRRGRGDGRRPRPIELRSSAGGPDRVSSSRAPPALFDPGRVALGLGPRLRRSASAGWANAEDALITRPDADVRVRVLPPLGYDFALLLREGATLIEAALALNDPAFDFGTHLVGLVESGAVASIIPGSPS